MNQLPILNISTYAFLRLDQLAERRLRYRTWGNEQGLRGTILLAPEGINVFLSGSADAVRGFCSQVSADIGLELKLKESWTEDHSFKRFKVKLKKEIIPFGDPSIDPSRESGLSVSARQLKEWLDRGEDLILLDTRNDYEVEQGTFKGAVDLKLKQFRYFGDAAKVALAEKKEQRIVMFCTGGIRCEKASLYLSKQGFERVYQLEGGILKYFEECGQDHYEGDCFVFDERRVVDSELNQGQPHVDPAR